MTSLLARPAKRLRVPPRYLALLFLPLAVPGRAAPPAPSWQAGAAAVDITPDGPVWQAGFAKRAGPSQGVALPIHAKALALADGGGARVVIVTLDLVGIPLPLREKVAQEAARRYRLPPESLLLNSSHTHSAPALSREEVEVTGFYGYKPADPVYADRAEAYLPVVEEKTIQVIGQALANLQPATLDYTHAHAGFAMNRRLHVGTTVRHEASPDGPVDPDVPVLRVSGADGRVRAILFGYACHNTAVTGAVCLINGDYAGYAQVDLEKEHPGAVALFVQGAAGDQNPYPRGTLEYAARFGRSLADAVDAALSVSVLRPVAGPLRTALGHAQLAYAEDSRADLERRLQSSDKMARVRAAAWLKQLDATGKLPTSYPCPVQVIRFGTDLLLVAVGGEPTVEYSLRLKRELAGGPAAVWFAGYSNDVFGYLGSRQVLIEGGYEGYDTNVDSARHPGPYALSIEDRVVGEVYDLIRETNH